jgi:uncharacterized membrane protein
MSARVILAVMNVAVWIISLSVVAAGLFAGLMMTLIIVMDRMWRTLEAAEFAVEFPRFLAAAKGHPIIAGTTFLSFLGPASGGIALLSVEPVVGVICLIAALVFFVGAFLVTILFNFPLYETAQAWTAGAPADMTVRSRFLRLNLVRFGSSASAFAMLVLAVRML